MSAPVFTVNEFAAAIKKHRGTVERWCRVGVLKAKKFPGTKEWVIYQDPLEFNPARR